MTPRPIEFLVVGRGGACFYIPYIAFAIFLAVVAVDAAQALGRVAPAADGRLMSAILLGGFALLWCARNDGRRRHSIQDQMNSLGVFTADVIRQMDTLAPRAPPKLPAPSACWIIAAAASRGSREPRPLGRMTWGGFLRIVVAGAAGFIGSHFCDRLISDGHTIVALDNLLTGSTANLSGLQSEPRFAFREQDITRPFTVDGPVDAVANLASPASPKDYLEHPIETLDVGSLGTRRMLELALEKGARFLLTSTSECYGDPLVHPQVETYWGNVNPVGPRSCYDESKRFAEAITMAYHRKHGVRTNIARIFNTYGPRMKLDDGRVVPAFLDQALRGMPITVFGDGSQTRSFCYVSDLVDGLCRLMLSEERYPVNLGNPREMTILEFAEHIRKMTGASSPIEFQALPEDDPKVRRPDITKARTLLGWSPEVTLEEGLRHTVEYFRGVHAGTGA